MLPYSQFDECIDLLTDPIDSLSPNNPNHTPLLGSAAKIYEYYIKHFTSELEEKITNKNNQEQKEDLIRLYLSRLMKSKNHRSIRDVRTDSKDKIPTKDINNTPAEIRNVEGILDMHIPFTLSHELKFREGCNILYHLIFDELQGLCVTFNIPFISLCKELEFDLEAINHEYSDRHEQGGVSAADERPGKMEAQPILKFTPDPEIKTTLAHIRESENRFWKGLPMSFVIDHFHVLTKKKSRNGEPFLTEAQFISFLKKGFLNDSAQPVQKINCAIGEKGMIIKIFYKFFELATVQYECTYTKEIYIQLFTDCFNNWAPDSIKEFFVPNRVRKQL